MEEEFLQYVWLNRLYEQPLEIEPGVGVKVLHPGDPNLDAGPDFFNAMIEMEGICWAGNVEVHRQASDWFRHKHHHDKAYDAVILHVVLVKDAVVCRPDGQPIPTVQIRFRHGVRPGYRLPGEESLDLPCRDCLAGGGVSGIRTWMETLVRERLESKTAGMERDVRETGNHWPEIAFRQLVRSFGTRVNKLPFDLMSRNIPYPALLQVRHRPLEAESLVFGQAGFLSGERGDAHFRRLRKQYHSFMKEYRLESLGRHLWRFFHLRPNNFPTIRLAQMAFLFAEFESFYGLMAGKAGARELSESFRLPASPYWDRHYMFNTPSAYGRKRAGRTFANLLVINGVVPFRYFYGRQKRDPDFADKAFSLLKRIPGEKNRITARWEEMGISADNAFITQGVIHLNNNYCTLKKCLSCRIGHQIISRFFHERDLKKGSLFRTLPLAGGNPDRCRGLHDH